MLNTSDFDNLDEDIQIELSQHTEVSLSSALMIRRRLNNKQKKQFDKTDFLKKYPEPRKLDIGCGNIKEEGWIRLDCNERFKPDLLMDAHNILLEDCCVDKARMNYVLGYTINPANVLAEIWRVLKPNSKLYLTNGAPASDIQLMPGVKHSFPKEFWIDVTEKNKDLYIPIDQKGYWSLIEERYDWSQTATRVASKLKLTRDVVIDTFRNVAKNQYVILEKNIL